jgi:hypothetical protein
MSRLCNERPGTRNLSNKVLVCFYVFCAWKVYQLQLCRTLTVQVRNVGRRGRGLFEDGTWGLERMKRMQRTSKCE